MATTESAWMPPTGRHAVNIGGSLARALKARKGLPTKPSKNKNLPVSDFYMCRYNFKPESVDTTKPGTVEVTQGKEATTVRMERASHQPDEVHIFRGKAEPAKEVECVLIYNEEDGMFTLEKLDSFITLSHEGRAPAKNRPQSSSPPLPTPSPAPSISKAEQDDLQAELDRELLTTLLADDAEGDVDDEFEEIVPISVPKPSTSASRKHVVEEEIIIPPQPKPQPPKVKPKLRASKKLPPPPPAAIVSAAAAAVPKAAAPAKGKGKGKRDVGLVDLEVDEEDLQFGQPAKQVKRAHVSPPVSNNVLALPTSSNALSLPTNPAAVVPSPAPAFSLDLNSESEEEWDEVMRPGVVGNGGVLSANGGDGDGSIFGDGEDEAGEEIDLNLFEAEMKLELEEDGEGDEDDDGLFGGEVGEPSPVATGRPMSLNQFAGGGEPEQDDDDYSSSEDSDDD